MHSFAEWLYATRGSAAIQSALWFIRLLQGAHLLTAGVAAVSGLMIALRALGWQRADEPFAIVWRRFAPWLGGSALVMVATGLLQTLGDPVRELTSTSYWVKLALLVLCAAGTLSLARCARRASPSNELPLTAKLIAAGLILSWCAIVLLGRMIAYDLAFWGELSLRT